MLRWRYPILVFVTLAVVIVGYAFFAGGATESTVENLVELQARQIADLVARVAQANDEVRAAAEKQRERADQAILDVLAALVVEEGPRRIGGTTLAILQRYLKELRLDRMLLVDAERKVVLDQGRPERPGKEEPGAVERIEEAKMLTAAARIARGEEEPRAEADARAVRVYRRVADRYCLVLVRSEERLREMRLEVGIGTVEQFQDDPTVAYVRLVDAAGAAVARATGRPSSDVVEWTRDFDDEYRLVVGVNIDRQARAAARRARSLPLLIGIALAVAGGLLILIIFRLQHAHLERERELRTRAEHDRRLASLGRLTAGVAHEIKNPLNAIRLSAGRLQRRILDGDQPIIDAITTSVGSITNTVEDFMKLAREPHPTFEEADPGAVFSEAVAQVRPMAEELGKELAADSSLCSGRARLDRARLREALVNLLRNALQAARGRVETRVRRDGTRYLFDVDDDGPGIPRAQRREIFEFFYTTKADGTGLGLPLAHRVAEEHGGSLDVADAPRGGARFTLSLPASGPPG